jgi:hypothetical protein
MLVEIIFRFNLSGGVKKINFLFFLLSGLIICASVISNKKKDKQID